MKNKFLNISIFVISIFCLIISLKLFWNMGIYIDEANTTPSLICGGDFWLKMDWLRLFASGFLVILSGINLFNRM